MTIQRLLDKATDLFREYYGTDTSDEEMEYWAKNRFLIKETYQAGYQLGWKEASKEFETDAKRAQEQYDDGFHAGKCSILELDVMEKEEQVLVKEGKFHKCTTCGFMVASDKLCRCSVRNKLREKIIKAIKQAIKEDDG
ncbi:MAG: hypothetical protein U9O78_04025 [Patescibacteria group bacterium]|nr:hypothetical protein [Patescibacteria group bacterium]